MSTSPADFNRQIIDEFHANEGRVGGMFEGVPLLLLHHTGAKTGTARINPPRLRTRRRALRDLRLEGRSATNPDWYHNLKAHPEVSIKIGTDTTDMLASEASGDERDRLFNEQAARVPQFGEYERKAGRTIPVVVLTPR